MKHLLIIGQTYPEPSTTAAGVRMMQLIGWFTSLDFEVTFATTASPGERSADLGSLGVHTIPIQLNDDGFDQVLRDIQPSIVMFDRFMTEEQFSWRVREQLPNCLRVLDTEDLHFLRKARESAVLNDAEPDFDNDITKRELASILRSDLSLIISKVEMALLTERFGIPGGILEYLPLTYPGTSKQLTFDQRNGFITIGNFQHHPNKDSISQLVRQVWPGIRKQVKDATLRIYGAYPTSQIAEVHDPGNGIFIMGWAEDIREVFTSSRILLAPLRFGAGLKGKVLEALYWGTPVVTTRVGAEGIGDEQLFGGVITDDPETFISSAVALYMDKLKWNEACEKGQKLIDSEFSINSFKEGFMERIGELMDTISERRDKHYLSKVIWHQNLRASYFMGKWITEKNRKNE